MYCIQIVYKYRCICFMYLLHEYDCYKSTLREVDNIAKASRPLKEPPLVSI